MNRYPIRPRRRTVLLDGSWKFAFLGEAAPEAVDPSTLALTDIAAVPGCYDTAGEMIGKRGVAAYDTEFEAAPGPARLTIGGLGLYGRIFIDGELLRDVKTPYSTVTADFIATGARQRLMIILDNRFDAERTPLFKGDYDFYGYGGVYRGVRIESLPQSRLERAAVTVLDLDIGRVRVEVTLGGDIPTTASLRYRFDDGVERNIEATPSGGRVTFEANVPDFRVWSPEKPHLHILHLWSEHDALIERFGLRTIATRGRQILLNGAPLHLLGVNRHEAHPQFGAVQPTQLMVDDLKWARELGANFIRGAHYQQNPEFLELCDETGVLVWNESLAWGLTDADSERPETVDLLCEATRIMSAECVNNPSVIICGFLNECNADTPSGRKMHERMAQAVRESNRNCLVSYAGNRFERDICTDLVDVISVNPYPGWISHLDSPITEYRTVIKPAFDHVADIFSDEKYGDKPLLISEAGACGVFGVRDRMRAQWSEEFQADYFAEVLGAVLDNPRFCGVTLWQFFDCRSFVNTGQIRAKPRGFNCAGLLDEYRRPKLAFDEVKRRFHAAKTR